MQITDNITLIQKKKTRRKNFNPVEQNETSLCKDFEDNKSVQDENVKTSAVMNK